MAKRRVNSWLELIQPCEEKHRCYTTIIHARLALHLVIDIDRDRNFNMGHVMRVCVLLID